MKINVNRKRQAGGILLLTVLGLLLILGIYLGGYLYWVRTENLLVAQSQAWNAALANAEAGIEEGLAQINVGFGTNYGPSIATNWASAVTGTYGPRTNTLAGGSYSVIVLGNGVCPTIISTGYAVVPFVGRQIARTVQVTTTNFPAFGLGMASEQNITLNGNNIAIDSFDSSDPNHSTNGMYYAPTRKAGGDVASLFGLVSVNNANINGHLYTGPSANYSVGNNGFVGDLSWTGPGIESGWWSDDFNVDIKDVVLPDMTGALTPGPVGTNTYYLATGKYTLNGDLSMKSGDLMFVAGYSTLCVNGNVNMQGSSQIYIAPGAQLKIYVAGASASFTTVNFDTTGLQAGNTFTFQYYGLPSNTSLSWSGNATYVGTVYAPEAAFSCGGGGSNPYDFMGACVVYSISMNGHFNFHYDENLLRNGPPIGFAVTSWQEL